MAGPGLVLLGQLVAVAERPHCAIGYQRLAAAAWLLQRHTLLGAAAPVAAARADDPDYRGADRGGAGDAVDRQLRRCALLPHTRKKARRYGVGQYRQRPCRGAGIRRVMDRHLAAVANG